jgi:hypothetical protein
VNHNSNLEFFFIFINTGTMSQVDGDEKMPNAPGGPSDGGRGTKRKASDDEVVVAGAIAKKTKVEGGGAVAAPALPPTVPAAAAAAQVPNIFIIKPTENFDFKTNFQLPPTAFRNPKNGSMSTSITIKNDVSPNQRPLIELSNIRMPFGAVTDDKFGTVKVQCNVPLENPVDLKFFTDMQEWGIEEVGANQVRHYGKQKYSAQSIRDFFCKFVRPPTREAKEGQPAFCPILQMKIGLNNDMTPKCKIRTEDRKPKTIADIKKGSVAKRMLVEVPPFWYGNNQLGIPLKVKLIELANPKLSDADLEFSAEIAAARGPSSSDSVE